MMKSFLHKYKYIIIILTLSIFIFLSYLSYTTTREAIEARYQTQNALIENSIISSINSARKAYTIAEQQLNSQMREYSLFLLDKYRENPELVEEDLSRFKKEMVDFDIYIIDENFKIINTTDVNDLGLDFSKYPAFSRLLNKRLQGNSFEVDRMDISTNTGKLKKYSYQPTPDHRYLLELGIDISSKYPQLGELNIFSLSRDLVAKYETVTDIEIFKFNEDGTSFGRIKVEKNPINTDIPETKKELIKKAIKQNQVIHSTADPANPALSYEYIPFLTFDSKGELSWWNSYIIGVVYNHGKMLAGLNRQKHTFYLNLLIIILVFALFTTIMVYLLKRTEHLAYHDHLTKLPNRKLFEELFQKKSAGSRGQNNQNALLFLDLDNFKKVNDKYGHSIGDEVLKAVADRLRASLRKGDIISRLGGDEFVVLLPNIKSRADAERVAAKINLLFKEPLKINNRYIYVQVSIGISTSAENGMDLEKLIQRADFAMYQSKGEKIR